MRCIESGRGHRRRERVVLCCIVVLSTDFNRSTFHRFLSWDSPQILIVRLSTIIVVSPRAQIYVVGQSFSYYSRLTVWITTFCYVSCAISLGSAGPHLTGLRRFLHGRVQQVFYKGRLSYKLELLFCVPTGSVLGPILFRRDLCMWVRSPFICRRHTGALMTYIIFQPILCPIPRKIRFFFETAMVLSDITIVKQDNLRLPICSSASNVLLRTSIEETNSYLVSL